jgi:hypothetical protein
MALHELRGAGAPTSTPTQPNQHYLDTTSGNLYISKGTSSSADWVMLATGASAVSSFNGRAGAVVPQSGDYTPVLVGADPAGASATVQSNLNTHIADIANPHSTTKAQVGLSNVDNTSDLNKPISTATQTALNAKVTANTAVTGATKTKLTYDSKGLVTAGADANLDDLSDVIISTPIVNDVLQYNGVEWVNNPLVPTTNGGAGVDLFLSATASGIAGYDLMSRTPDTAAEVDESIVVVNTTSPLIFENYIQDAAIGSTSVDPGTCYINFYKRIYTEYRWN